MLAHPTRSADMVSGEGAQRRDGAEHEADGGRGKPVLLVLASTYPPTVPDGTPAFVRDLAQQVARDFEVVVVTPRVAGGTRVERDGPLTIHRYAYFLRRWEDLADGAIIENLRSRRSRWIQVPFFFLFQFLAVRRAARRYRPRAVHAHWIIPQGMVARLAVPRLPTLVTTLGGDLYALRAAPLRAVKSSVVRRARAVTVMNREMRDMVVEMGAEAASVRVLPMGAEIPADEAPGRPERTGVLFVGRLVEKKGLSFLLDAIGSLDPAERPPLTVVGDGPLRASLQREAAGLGVTFLGQLDRDALRQQFRSAAVSVFPSAPASSGDRDGLPVALLEALGSSCPVIVSDMPGLSDVVTSDREGLVVPPADSAALAAAIRTAMSSPERRMAWGEAARSRSLDYSVEAIGASYRRILRAVIAGDALPD